MNSTSCTCDCHTRSTGMSPMGCVHCAPNHNYTSSAPDAVSIAISNPDAAWASVRLECFHALGFALLYMDYLYPSPGFKEQRKRIIALCQEAAANSIFVEGVESPGSPVVSVSYWNHLLHRIREETENMC